MSALALSLALLQTSSGGPVDSTAADAVRTREQRLAADRAGLERTWEAMAAFGHQEPFLEAVNSALDVLEPEQRWIKARDERGWLLVKIVNAYAVWNTPLEGRELPCYADHEAPRHALDVIVDFAEQLRSRDVDFLLVNIPSRLQVYPELLMELPESEGFAGMAPGTTRTLLDLVDAGVEVLDLMPAFIRERAYEDRDELFLHYNTHWTPRAIELAAQQIADRLRQYPWFEPGHVVEGEDFRLEEGVFDFRPANQDPPPDCEPQPIRGRRVTGVGNFQPATISKSSPIILLGDSFPPFLDGIQCDLISQTMRFSGHHLDAITNKGGGIKTCRDALRRRRDGLAEDKIVIWVMPSPSLIPHDDWKKVRLFRRNG